MQNRADKRHYEKSVSFLSRYQLKIIYHLTVAKNRGIKHIISPVRTIRHYAR